MTTTTSNERTVQTFKDEAQLERHLCHALSLRDWEWVSWIREDARLMYSDALARFERKYGLSDYTVAVSLRLLLEAEQPAQPEAPKQEKLF